MVPSPDSRVSGKWWSRIYLAFISSIFTLFLIEIILRVSGFPLLIGRLAEPDDVIGYRYKKNLATYITFEGRRFPFLINEEGFRDRPVNAKKTAQEFRIVLFGDSVVAAHEVAAEERLTEQLEYLLNANSDRKKRVRVINAGVRGFSTLQCLLAFKKYIDRWRPDLVLYLFTDNDPADCLNRTGLEGHFRPAAKIENGKLKRLPMPDQELPDTQSFSSFRALFRWGCERSVLMELLRSRVYVPTLGRYGKFEVDLDELHHASLGVVPNLLHLNSKSREAWEVCMGVLSEFAELAQRRNVVFVTTSFVGKWHIDRSFQARMVELGAQSPNLDWNFAEKKLTKHAAAYHYRYVSLRGEFESVPDSDSLYPKTDLHWNSFGHFKAAKVLAAELKPYLNAH